MKSNYASSNAQLHNRRSETGSGKIGSSAGDLIFEILNTILMLFVVVITLYPFINILAISLNDAGDAAKGSIYLWPRVFSLASYQMVFESEALLNATLVTLARTVMGTAVSVLSCALLAFALSKKKLAGRNIYFLYFIFSMLFSGGLIPTYLVYRGLGLIDKFAVYIVPSIINVGSVLLIMMFFREIPEELEESCKIDGAGDFIIFLKIYLPLSLPCLATISLYAAVGHWNSWFDSMIYVTNRKLQVLQLLLQQIITQSAASSLESARASGKYKTVVSPETIKAAITIVTTLPIIMVYPFLQKYFVKGLIIGAIKG